MLIIYKLARNTFIECIREPIYFLMLASALIMIGLFPTAAMFVFREQIKLVVDSSMANASYKIHAVVTYNDCKVSSNTLTITIGSGVTSESGSTSSSSSSHAGSSGSTAP